MNSPADPADRVAGETLEVLKAGDDLPRTACGALAPRVVAEGWAILYVTLSERRRQILGFLLPGDSVGALASERPLNRAQARALTRLRLATHPLLDESVSPAPSRLFGVAIQEERLLVDHIVRLGQQTAFERTIHLLLELHDRLAASGLADNGAFNFPVTQEVLADALGLSIVHVNRVLQRLRREGMIEIKHQRLALLDPTRMRSNCDYASSFVATSF